MQRRIVLRGQPSPQLFKEQLMERRFAMIDKPTNIAASSSADVPRVGGEDKSRASDLDFRVGHDNDTREVVDDQRPGACVSEKK